jgi:hypothetical protein
MKKVISSVLLCASVSVANAANIPNLNAANQDQKFCITMGQDAMGDLKKKEGGGGNYQGTRNVYQNGYLQKQLEARNSGNTTKTRLMEILAMDAFGHVTSSIDANEKTTASEYLPQNGLIYSIMTEQGRLQDIVYTFDGARNLRGRNNASSRVNQKFTKHNQCSSRAC